MELDASEIKLVGIRNKSVSERVQLQLSQNLVFAVMRPLQRKRGFAHAFGSAMLYQHCRPRGRVNPIVMIDGPPTISRRPFTEGKVLNESSIPHSITTSRDLIAYLRMMGIIEGRCGVWSNRNPRKKSKKWTEEVTKKTKELLQKGCQIWEIAHHLERPHAFVRRKLKSDEELRGLLKPVKTGAWSNKEVEYLTRLRIEGLHKSVIAKRLGRSQVSLAKKNVQQTDQIRNMTKPPTFQGPQALSPALVESIFQARLRESWECLMRSEMTETWKEVLLQKTAELWLSAVSENTSKQAKQLLAGQEPPTVAELEALSWTETSNAGVYGWILKPRSKFYLNKEVHLYVGSASKYSFGLEWRKHQHLSESKLLNNPRLRSLIKRKKMGRKGHFITLMTLETDNGEKENVLRARYLATLAESIFTVWLGAFAEKMEDKGDIRSHCPWGKDLPYSGCSSHNPLTKDINLPRDDSNTARLGDSEWGQEIGHA